MNERQHARPRQQLHQYRSKSAFWHIGSCDLPGQRTRNRPSIKGTLSQVWRMWVHCLRPWPNIGPTSHVTWQGRSWRSWQRPRCWDKVGQMLLQRFPNATSYAVPSKHKTFVWQLYNVGPTSSTLAQHCTNVIQMFRVRWVDTHCQFTVTNPLFILQMPFRDCVF